MPRSQKWENQFPTKKQREFQAGHYFRGKVGETHTAINLQALRREYKLGQAYQVVRNLEYRGSEQIVHLKYDDYIGLRGDLFKLKLSATEEPRPTYPEDESYRNSFSTLHHPNGRVLVLVDSQVFEALSASIDQYVLDLGRDGYWATIHKVTGGTPKQVRAYIHEFNPVGAVLVGSLAVPWYEIDGDQFPCDLYYMDKNGTWSDADSDGKFDGHAGDVVPEVWIGRLWTPTAGGNDAALLNDYFVRNHAFRIGALGHARSALAYVDDDWQGFGDCAFDEMFPSSVITEYTNPVTTDADLYKAEVNSLRSWVQLCAHSWVTGHSFTVGTEHEYINSAYFRDTNPPNAHFYNLFCCGPGKFSVGDYLAGWYIFDKAGGVTSNGLAAVASAKSGSMLFFEDFYGPMGAGKVIGDAYIEWWNARGPIFDDSERYWFYGLVLLGDPTLNWWKGAVPRPMQPQEDDVFDHWPRKMQMRWHPVEIPGTRYSVEIDAFHAIHAGQWAEQTGSTFFMRHNVTGTILDHSFVGAQRGRWRVRAKVDSTLASWSPWSYFRFTV